MALLTLSCCVEVSVPWTGMTKSKAISLWEWFQPLSINEIETAIIQLSHRVPPRVLAYDSFRYAEGGSQGLVIRPRQAL